MARGMHKPKQLEARKKGFPGRDAGKTEMHMPGSNKK